MNAITRPPEHREDDDPCPPESPLDSAQSRRAQRLPVVIEALAIDTSRRESVALSVA